MQTASKTHRRVRTEVCATLAVTLALVLAPAMAGCNLISVATLVGKRFVPALAKGKRKSLKKHSSWRLAWYWDGFTDLEIETAVKGNPAMQGRKAGKPGAKQKKRKKPSVGLVSFKSKGNHARLVARRGKMRISFDCVREGGRWKVDEVSLPIKGKKTRLSQVLKLLLAAKAIQAGMETGSRYLLVNISTPRLRRQVWDRLSDAELEALTSSATSSRKTKKRRKKKKGPKITTKFLKDRAIVSLAGGALPASIVLLERDGQYWVDDVKIKLGGQWQNLGDLVGYLQPALGLVHWARDHLLQPRSDAPPTPAQLATLIARMRAALSTSLWSRTFAWLTPADLKLLPWKAIRKALKPRPKKKTDKPSVKSSPGLGPKAIEKFHRRGNRLDIALKLPDTYVALTMKREAGSWRLHKAVMTRKGQTLQLADLLEALAPMVRLAARAGKLVPAILMGNNQSNAALAKLMTAVRGASSRDLNRRLWSRLPPELLKHVPLHVLPAALKGLVPDPNKGPTPPGKGADSKKPKLPAVTLVKTLQTKRRLALTLQVAKARVTVVLVRESTGWKLDDVIAPLAGKRRSMKLVLAMMAPAAALANAVLSGKGDPLRQAVSPNIRRTVITPLLRILGPRFGSLMHTLRTQTLKLPDKTKKAARKTRRRRRRRRWRRPRPRPRPRPVVVAASKPGPPTKVEFKSLTVDPSGRRSVIKLQLGPMAPLKIVLTRDKAQVWRIADVVFPLGGRTLSLSRTGPVLAPLFGFGISLLTQYLPGIRRACSYSFNKAVWRRMTRAKFKKLIKQFMPKGKSSPGPARAGGKKAASKVPRLVALRVKDTGRWHWAQVTLKIGKRKIRISLVGVKGRWSVHDVHLTIGGQLLSLKTAAVLLL